jgi:hypothetical protein
MMFFSFIFIFIAFLSLSLAMKRYYDEIHQHLPKENVAVNKAAVNSVAFNRVPVNRAVFNKQKILYRLLAGLSLLLSYFCCIDNIGVALGLVYWTALLTLAAFLQAMLLTYQAQWLYQLAFFSGLIPLVAKITQPKVQNNHE